MKSSVIAILPICILLSSSVVRAGSSEFVPIQQRAMGESLTGAVMLNDSLFSNPAGSAFTNVYTVDGSFLSPQAFSVSVLDTKTSPVGGGLAYYRVPREALVNGAPSFVQGGRLALLSRVSDHVGVGVTGKMVWGPDLSGAQGRLTDLDVGGLVHFERVQFGATVQNILGGSQAMGEFGAYAVGARVNWEQSMFFSASMLGELVSMQPRQVGLGVEYVSPYYFALKGGYRYQTFDGQSYWGTGVSILSPKVSLHYALEIPNQGDSSLIHSVGTTFLF